MTKFEQPIGFEFYIKKVFGRWLNQEGVTEICVNRPNEIFFEKNQTWFNEKIDFSYDDCSHLAKSIAAYKKDKITTTKPLLSAAILGDERVQVVFPPACEANTISVTMRIPSKKRFAQKDYLASGFYSEVKRYGEADDEDSDLIALYNEGVWDQFTSLAVKKKKNIVVAGATGTGKTTFMKTLVDSIPPEERIITIEDTHELNLINHKNYVHLFYPSEAKEGDIVTASSLLKCCMRMRPDRILLTELRGAETFDFLKALKSGHDGSITSVHAGSVEDAFQQMASYVKAHPQGLATPHATILSELKQKIDVILSIVVRNKKRILREVYFRNAQNAK